jgi:hypothetical protein
MAIIAQTTGIRRQRSRKMRISAILLHTKMETRLRVQKYRMQPRMANTFIKIRWRPPPSERPSRNSAAAHISQNRKSVSDVTAFERVLCRTMRKKSYKKPAAAPSKREEAASIS